MNILVTGGAGYIGSHTVVELAAAGYRPVIIDNFSNSSKGVIARLMELTGNDIAFYQQDFQDKAGLLRVVENERIEAIIHFSALKDVGASVADPLSYYQHNTADFIGLLHNLSSTRVKTVIFSSTAAVYGNPPGGKASEDTPCQPESPYGWSKYMDEIILRDTCMANPSLKGVALRYFNVVGSHESGRIGEQSKTKPQNLLPIIVQAASGAIPPFTVYGNDYPTPDGTCLRDYIHVTDLARAHVAALKKATAADSTPYRTYNIGTGKPTSVLELVKAFESANGIKVPFTLGPKRAGDPVVSYASIGRAEDELGWRATRLIVDACRDAWRWQTENSESQMLV